MDRLLDVMRRLRDPETGCAWDLEQDFKSIAPYAIEEAYEVVDAIDRDDLHDLKDELGDLLLQVVFHSQMASELGEFGFKDVVTGIVDKMIRRHPHVFGEESFSNTSEVKASWEAIKAQERADKKASQSRKNGATEKDTALKDELPSALDGIARSLPALKQADKIQKRAARVGFDWPDVEPVFDKINEEVAEVKDAVARSNADDIEDELGDLLFTVVNLTRHYGVDAERALAKANDKFSGRFRQVEELAHVKGVDLKSLSLDELDSLWNLAKKNSA